MHRQVGKSSVILTKQPAGRFVNTNHSAELWSSELHVFGTMKQNIENTM